MVVVSFLCAAVLLVDPMVPALGLNVASRFFSGKISSSSSLYVVPLQSEEEATRKQPVDGTSNYFPTQFLDWNASGSIGSLLMQMQRKEEEMRKFNKTLLDKDQAVDLSRHNNSNIPSKMDQRKAKSETKSAYELDIMDPGKARELDEAVTLRISSSPGKDVQILELPRLYRVLQEAPGDEVQTERDESGKGQGKVGESRKSVENRPLLSKAQHYEERIGRDMRQLAVSIASCIDDTEEFQTYCQQVRGGIYPLIECIREGAEAIRHRGKNVQGESASSTSYVSPDDAGSSTYDERFLAASSACRALRDLCGISSDLAVVITDTLLRANANKKELNIMEDLVTILQFAHDAGISVSSSKRPRQLLQLRRGNQPSKWKLNFSQNRRGTYNRANVRYFLCIGILAG
jgi:hypothetical protein